MPLVYQQNINLNTKLGVWHITETENFFTQHVSIQNAIRHPHKRLQHLAGRNLLLELFEDFPLELIIIADTKKPFLESELYHFSISHCADYAAVIASSSQRVGVDIEVISEKAERIKNKFLSGEEQDIIHATALALTAAGTTALSHKALIALAWGVKESIFKWYGKGAVDFKDHMVIEEIAASGNELFVRAVFLKNGRVPLNVRGLLFGNKLLTWLVSS